MNITLYNISNEQKAIMAEIEANEGELTDEIIAKIEFNEVVFHEKAIDYGYVIKQFEDTSDVIAKEIKRLQDLKKKADNNAERLRVRITEAMKQFGLTEVKSDTLRLSFRASKAVEVFDEKLIPSEYMKFTASPDKTAIKKAIELGDDVQGARVVSNDNLQIK
jgi:hypothetical protein